MAGHRHAGGRPRVHGVCRDGARGLWSDLHSLASFAQQNVFRFLGCVELWTTHLFCFCCCCWAVFGACADRYGRKASHNLFSLQVLNCLHRASKVSIKNPKIISFLLVDAAFVFGYRSPTPPPHTHTHPHFAFFNHLALFACSLCVSSQ